MTKSDSLLVLHFKIMVLSGAQSKLTVAATSELCVPLGNKDTALLNIFKITAIRVTVLSTVRK